MQELAHHVYIETGYGGVTLGAISWPHGMVLIDAPIRMEDARSWRAALMNLNSGVDHMLVNLDAHFDRTLGVRAMDYTVIGHDKMAGTFRNRPVTFKTQGTETGAEWELFNGLGSVRWVPPEITFSDHMVIHWDAAPLSLEYHPGPSVGAIWAVLPHQRIAFVGDALTPDQPPYLAMADIPAWIATIQTLLTPQFQDYLIISGRGGPVANVQIRQQIQFLEKAHTSLEALAAEKAPASATEALAEKLLQMFHYPEQRAVQYHQRLVHGLRHYYTRHYLPNEEEFIE